MMDWSIQHLMSSPRFPHGNADAEKAVGIVKELYTKCHDVKLIGYCCLRPLQYQMNITISKHQQMRSLDMSSR